MTKHYNQATRGFLPEVISIKTQINQLYSPI